VSAWSRPKIFAHRGGDDGPENSVAAIARAGKAGADGVEIDIQIDADGRPVAKHDLSRTAEGSGDGSGDGPDRGSGVASLAEVLAAVEAADLLLLIDFKSGGDHRREAGIVADALSTFDRPELLMVSSFSLPFLEQLQALRPDLPLYPIVSLRQNFVTPLDFDRWAGASVLVHALLVNPMLWLAPKRADRTLLVWFAISEWEPLPALAARLGARGLIVKKVGSAAEKLR
jgi:glycerophosphoryl diester phosphodiesterase